MQFPDQIPNRPYKRLWAIIIALIVILALIVIEPGDQKIQVTPQTDEAGQDINLKSDVAEARSRPRPAAVIAQARWGRVCGGQIPPIVQGTPRRGAAAEARYHYLPGRPRYTRGYFNCSIVVTSTRRFSRDQQCGLIVHEYGHFKRGPKHSRDPRSIMFWKLTNINIPLACRTSLGFNDRRSRLSGQ